MADTWDRSAEMVVIGFGGAGAAAALAGAELGASVLILEKQPQDRHTPSTAMSGGIVMATNDRVVQQGCAVGQDAFGRPLSSLVPLDSPPYYCMPLYPGGPNTCGGPRRDEHARILSPSGQPIPGLYGAGELGEAVGMLYPANGGNLSESVCFGRLAAEHAMGRVLPLLRRPRLGRRRPAERFSS